MLPVPGCPQRPASRLLLATGQPCFLLQHGEGKETAARKPLPWVCFVGWSCAGFDAIAGIHSDITMFSTLNHRFP